MHQNHHMIMRHAVVGDSGSILTTRSSFKVHPMYGTRAFLHSTPIELRLPWLDFDPATLCFTVQHQGPQETTADHRLPQKEWQHPLSRRTSFFVLKQGHCTSCLYCYSSWLPCHMVTTIKPNGVPTQGTQGIQNYAA